MPERNLETRLSGINFLGSIEIRTDTLQPKYESKVEFARIVGVMQGALIEERNTRVEMVYLKVESWSGKKYNFDYSPSDAQGLALEFDVSNVTALLGKPIVLYYYRRRLRGFYKPYSTIW